VLGRLRVVQGGDGAGGGKLLSETLAWELQWGSEYETLLEIADKGAFYPEALAKRPELPVELRHWLEVFYFLNTDRPIGGMGGVGYIPFSSKARYCDEYGVTSVEDRDWFFRLIGRLDQTYMEYQAEKAESKSASEKQATSP
jgi:hypothetical protein